MKCIDALCFLSILSLVASILCIYFGATMNDGSGGFLLAFMGGFLFGSCSIVCLVFWSVYKFCPPRRRTNQISLGLLSFANAVIAANEASQNKNASTKIIKQSTTKKPDHQTVDIPIEVAPPTYEETVLQEVDSNALKKSNVPKK